MGAQQLSAIHGRVADEDGLPVAGALVQVEGGARASVDAEGRFRIGGLRPGKFRLLATAPGFRAAVVELFAPREGEELRRDLTLVPDPVQMSEVLTLVDRGEQLDSRHVLRREEILRAGSVARALGRVPGVFVKEFGAGGAREVSIRGGAPEQTLVLWGEERLLSPAGGAVDLGAIPPHAVDSIAVITRGASSRHGGGALAGVVRLYPTEPRARNRMGLGAEAGAGSSGIRHASSTVALPLGPAGLALSLGTRAYDRDFGRREGAGGEERDGFIALGLPMRGLSATGAFHSSERGAPGPLANPTPEARSTAERTLVTAAYERAFRGWKVRGEVSAQHAAASYSDRDRPAVGADSRASSLAMRAGVAREHRGRRVETGFEARRERLSESVATGRAERRELGLYAAGVWRATRASPFALSPGLRLDWITMEGGPAAGTEAGSARERTDVFVSPSLAAALELGRGLFLRGHAGRSFRYPGFQDLAFISGLGVRSNPALREERSRDFELGLDWSPEPGVSASAAVFDRRLEGAIVWLPDFQFIWSPRNLPRARVRGVELSGRWRLAGGWELQGVYAWAPARFDFPGNRNPLPYRPSHVGRLEVAYGRGSFSTALEARLTGARYPNLAGTNALAGYVLAEWRATWRRDLASGELTLEARLENLLQSSYEVVFGFPAAPRSLHATLRYRLR